MLHVGGEQEAVIDPEPGDGAAIEQDSVQPAGGVSTAGFDPVQVNGILLNVTGVSAGRELFPITSVMTAFMFCAAPFPVTNEV